MRLGANCARRLVGVTNNQRSVSHCRLGRMDATYPRWPNGTSSMSVGLGAAALDRPVPRPGQGQGQQGDPAGAVSPASRTANTKAPPEGAALLFVARVERERNPGTLFPASSFPDVAALHPDYSLVPQRHLRLRERTLGEVGCSDPLDAFRQRAVRLCELDDRLQRLLKRNEKSHWHAAALLSLD
jgi:hypothetical protein